MSSSEFHGDLEIYLSVTFTLCVFPFCDLIIRYWKIVMQKLHDMRKQKSGPRKMLKIWMKNPEKQQKLDKINQKTMNLTEINFQAP